MSGGGECSDQQLGLSTFVSSSSGTLESGPHERSDSGKHDESNAITDNWRPWSDLPGDLLEMITKRLNIVDFFSVGDVCTRWRALSAAFKQRFLASLPPLMVFKQPYPDTSCYFFNMSNKSMFKVNLPAFSQKFCHGSYAGYLVLEDSNHNFMLINPFTRHEIQFARMTGLSHRLFLNDVTIAARLMPSQVPVLVSLDTYCRSLWFCRSTDAEWTNCSFADRPWKIVNMSVYKGKLYVITNKAEIGVLSLSSLDATLMEIKGTPIIPAGLNVHLVSADGKLLMVLSSSITQEHVYELDFEAMEWRRLNNLGDGALFLLSHAKFSTMTSNSSRWGGRGNCIYNLGFMNSCCRISSLGGEVLENMATTDAADPNDADYYIPYCWYIASLYNFADLSEID